MGLYYSGPTVGVNTISGNYVYANTMVSTSATASLVGMQIAGGLTTISNNAIALGSDSADVSLSNPLDIRGIYETGGTNSFYFNSVNISGSSVTNTTSTYAFYSALTTGNRIYKNNVFSNQRSYAVSPSTTANYAALISGTVNSGAIAGLTSNYNLFYANGVGGAAVLNGVGGTAYPFLGNWTSTAYGHEANSVSGDPNFTSVTFLRGLSGSSISIGDAGTGVTNDILGFTRVNNMMGAYDSYNPLPVSLTTFTAKVAGTKVLLNWLTASEINNNHFVVERSFDKKEWRAIGSVKGAGTTTVSTYYSYTDKEVSNNQSIYYRLKQVDHNGAYEYSKTVLVQGNAQQEIAVSVYPNPVSTTFTITGLTEGLNTVTIQDMTGKTVYTSSVPESRPTQLFPLNTFRQEHMC